MAKDDYFSIMERQVALSARAAEFLFEILADFKPMSLAAQREEMHKIEHEADEVRHDALTRLSRDFITPIEREDILQLVQILDDVTDAIDEVAIDLYMFHITVLPDAAKSLAALVLKCVRTLGAAVAEFRSFKKSASLQGLLVEVNSTESEADAAYIAAVRALFLTERDALRVVGVKAIYDSLESCCDLCEHAADVIGGTVMNNT